MCDSSSLGCPAFLRFGNRLEMTPSWMQALLSNLLELHMPALQNKLRKCLSWGKDLSDKQADVAGKTSSAANLVGVNVLPSLAETFRMLV